ncbi:MAG: arsenate reductase [Verrucomicrobiales bacterium]|jgi:arsenate reductase
MKIYHNPRCSKSRQTLQLLADAGVEPEIVEYLKNRRRRRNWIGF